MINQPMEVEAEIGVNGNSLICGRSAYFTINQTGQCMINISVCQYGWAYSYSYSQEFCVCICAVSCTFGMGIFIMDSCIIKCIVSTLAVRDDCNEWRNASAVSVVEDQSIYMLGL